MDKLCSCFYEMACDVDYVDGNLKYEYWADGKDEYYKRMQEQSVHKENVYLLKYTPEYPVETANISRLKRVASNLQRFDDDFSRVDPKNKFEMRLIRIREMLGSSEKKVDSLHGRAGFDKQEAIKIRYGLCRAEFLINEIKLSQKQGSSNDSYLKKLAMDVLEDLPLILDPERKGYGFVSEDKTMYVEEIAKSLLPLQKDYYLLDINMKDITHATGDIRVVASVLSSQPPSKWQYYFNEVLHKEQNPVKHVVSTIMQMRLQLELLSYYSLFPLDNEFSKEDFNLLWGAIDQQSIFSKPSKEAFDNYINKLLDSAYFSKSYTRDKTGVLVYYKARVLMHEVVKHLARDEFRLLQKPTEEADLGIQHVSFIVESSWKSPSWLYDAKQLKSLLFPPSKLLGKVITIPNLDLILNNLKALQALDLAMVDCRICLNFIGGLKYLKYLRLGISFEYLSEGITNLPFLQTLDLRYSKIKELPEGFYKLCCLRHLNTGGRLIDLPPRFQELTELQSLDVFIVGQNNGLDALQSLTQLTGKLKILYQNGHKMKNILPMEATYLAKGNVHDLWLVWSSSNSNRTTIEENGDYKATNTQFEFLQPPSTLKSLVVQRWMGVRFPPWAMERFSILLYNLVSIHLEDCSICQDLPSFSSLCNLESLHLWGLNSLEWIEICNDDSSKPSSSSSTTTYFPSLKYLVVADLPQLKGWSKHDVSSGEYQEKHRYIPQKIFDCLIELRISGCPNLISMPLVPSLETLEVVNINGKLLKNLFTAQESQAASSSSSVASPASSTLKELHIKSVHELESLVITLSSLHVLTIRECRDLKDFLVESSNSLIQLKIRACHKLKDVSRALHNLSVLEELELEGCEELDMMKGDGDDNAGASLQFLKNLRCLKLSNISDPEPLPRGLSCLTTLTELSLCWLYNLSVLPDSIGNLTQLSRLVIQYCPALKTIPSESLKDVQIEIKDCPKFKLAS